MSKVFDYSVCLNERKDVNKNIRHCTEGNTNEVNHFQYQSMSKVTRKRILNIAKLSFFEYLNW